MRFPRRYLVGLTLIAAAPAYAGITLSFDFGWRFLKGDAAAAEQPQFDDGAWRTVNVPHDWAIEGPFDEKNPAGGAGWFRKNFTVTAVDAKRRVFVDFDGVAAVRADNSQQPASPWYPGAGIVSYVTATVTDDRGVSVPIASDNVSFPYQGKCIAVVAK